MSSKYSFLLLFLFYILRTVKSYDQIFECSQTDTPTYNIDINKITLFQSPNFPENIQNNTLPTSCNANFTTNDPTNNIWILMLNGVISEIQFYDTHNRSNELTKQKYNSNFDVVNFTTSSNGLLVKAFSYESETSWAAFQAFVIPYPKNFQGCPLESKTFEFSSDTTSVIPVTPTFLLPDIEESYKLCKWFFTITQNQQLKVVVRKIDFFENDNITLILSNEKGVTHSFSKTDIDQVFYFDGQNFNIMYESDYANFSNTGFLIFVSAVTKQLSYTSNGCQPPHVNSTTQITTYSNIDYVQGYPAHQKCVNALTIPAAHEAQLSIIEYGYEGITDKLSINYGADSSKLITWKEYKQPIFYTLTSDISGGSLTFNSDGNTEGAGYRANLEVYECQCSDSNFVFQCEYTSYLRPMNGYFPYCSNLDCEYTITANSTCPEAYFSLSLENRMRKSIDHFIINDNQILLQNITADSGDQDFNFSPDSNVTIQFHSGPSETPITDEDKSWYIKVKPMQRPNFKKIILNQTNSKYVKWLADMRENDAIIVCSLTGTLEIFIPQLVNFYDLRDFFLYDSGDLNNFVGSLNSIVETAESNVTFPLSLKSNSGCFTLYLRDNFPIGKDYSIFFQNVDDSNKNCQDSNNVFQIPPPSMPNLNVTVKSTESGTCEMIILTSDYNSTLLSRIWISDISVSDMEGQYSVYSAENNKKLFSFKGSDASKWINFGVYAPALSISAPPSSSLTISMSGAYQALELINIPQNGIQNGIMASPSYSGFMQKFTTQMFYKSSGSTKFSTVFNVKEINGNAKPILENAGKNLTLTKGTYTTPNSFTLFYAEEDPNVNGFVIEYTIHSGDIPSSTTESTVITSSSNTEETSTKITSTSAMPTTPMPTTTPITNTISTTTLKTTAEPITTSASTSTISGSNSEQTTEPITTTTTATTPNTISSSGTSLKTSVEQITTTTPLSTKTTPTRNTISSSSSSSEKTPEPTTTTSTTTPTINTITSSSSTSTSLTPTKNTVSTLSSSLKTTVEPITTSSTTTVKIPTSTNLSTKKSTTFATTTNPTSISFTNQTNISDKTYTTSSTPSTTMTTPQNNSAKSSAFEFSLIFISASFFVLFN